LLAVGGEDSTHRERREPKRSKGGGKKKWGPKGDDAKKTERGVS